MRNANKLPKSPIPQRLGKWKNDTDDRQTALIAQHRWRS